MKVIEDIKKSKMNSNVFNFQALKNNHVDEVSDEMSCSTCDTENDSDLSIIALSNEDDNNQLQVLTFADLESSFPDKGRMTLAELECSDVDDMLSEISTVCYDESDHMEWDGSKTLPIGAVSPFNIEDVNEAQRLGLNVCEMFQMYREMNSYEDSDKYKNDCPPEWPLHVGINGSYEDEGFCESYYG